MFHAAFASLSASKPHAGQECPRTHNGFSVETPQDAHSSWSSLSGLTATKCVLSLALVFEQRGGTFATRQTRCCGCSTAIPSSPSRSDLRPPRDRTPARSTPRVCARSRGVSAADQRDTSRRAVVASRNCSTRVACVRASVARAPSGHARRRDRATPRRFHPCRGHAENPLVDSDARLGILGGFGRFTVYLHAERGEPLARRFLLDCDLFECSVVGGGAVEPEPEWMSASFESDRTV